MKSLLAVLTLSTLISVSANAGTILIEKNAKALTGTSSLTKKAPTACSYAVEKITYANGQEEIGIFLNSDKASMINGSVRLRALDIPLREGVILSKAGLVVSYDKGILTAKKTVTDDGPFNNDYKILKLAVSSDLKNISSGYVKNATKGVFKEIVAGEMNCQF